MRPTGQPAPDSSERTVTRLLREWSAGNPDALHDLAPEVVGELRRIATELMRRENRGQTLQPTALVNELYLRLRKSRTVSWHGRVQFFAFAARTMRRILVEEARARGRLKRAGGVNRVSLEEAQRGVATEPPRPELVDLDTALQRLEELDSRQARVVELRFFLGLTVDQIAAALEISVATVHREWATARAWLYRELQR